MRAAAATPALNTGILRAGWLGVPIYGLVTVIALLPDIVRTNLGIEPLQVEGLLLLVILLIGILLAWSLFTGPQATDEAASPAID
jgi:hypothetical protein